MARSEAYFRNGSCHRYNKYSQRNPDLPASPLSSQQISVKMLCNHTSPGSPPAPAPADRNPPHSGWSPWNGLPSLSASSPGYLSICPVLGLPGILSGPHTTAHGHPPEIPPPSVHTAVHSDSYSAGHRRSPLPSAPASVYPGADTVPGGKAMAVRGHISYKVRQ